MRLNWPTYSAVDGSREVFVSHRLQHARWSVCRFKKTGEHTDESVHSGLEFLELSLVFVADGWRHFSIANLNDVLRDLLEWPHERIEDRIRLLDHAGNLPTEAGGISPEVQPALFHRMADVLEDLLDPLELIGEVVSGLH
jgi:hypothetical protein